MTPPMPLNQRVPGLRFSVELEEAVAKAIAKKREDRHETAVDMAQALRACLKNTFASTAARRALPSSSTPPPSAVPSRAPRAGTSSGSGRPKPRQTLTEVAAAPTVPISRGPLIAIGAALAIVLLVVGIWVGSLLAK